MNRPVPLQSEFRESLCSLGPGRGRAAKRSPALLPRGRYRVRIGFCDLPAMPWSAACAASFRQFQPATPRDDRPHAARAELYGDRLSDDLSSLIEGANCRRIPGISEPNDVRGDWRRNHERPSQVSEHPSGGSILAQKVPNAWKTAVFGW